MEALADSPPKYSPLSPTPTKRLIDWPKVREAYIQRPERQTFDDLSSEFGIKAATIANASSDEGWPLLRAQFFENQLDKADAGAILVRALAVDRALSTRGASVGMVALDRIAETLNHEKMLTYSPSTRSEVTNTCMFAFLNAARALRELGITGISKTLDQAGKESNGQWNPQLLAQINVNVGEIIAKSRSELAAVVEQSQAPSVPVAVKPQA